MKLFVRKQKSSVFFLLTLLMLFGTSKIGYVQANKNRAPVFNEGARATRTVAENTAAGTNIGAPFTATDPDDGDTVTYSLHRKDRNAFRINPNTGQLQTRTALDYETKSAYDNLAVRATDSSGLTDAILVTINVTNVNEMPTFNIVGRSRTVAENTAAGTNIGAPFTGTDPDGDALTYSMYSGADRHAFNMVSTTGQLQTKDALDYETKNAYSFIISVSDGNGGIQVLSVTINVTDVEETPITPITPLNQRTQQVRDAILDSVPGVNNPADVTPEHLAAINELDLSNKGITSLKSGDFSGLTTLTNLDLKGNAITDIVPLEDLTTLTWLYLKGNAITDISALAAATKLTNLFLPNNAITDISALAGLTELIELHLGNTTTELGSNAISDISALAGLTKLTGLYLSNNSISDITALTSLTALTDLSLAGNSISGITALTGLTALTDLSLSSNAISDIAALTGLTKLTRLNLAFNSISDITALKDLTALTDLSLSDGRSDDLSPNSISDVSALENLTALKELSLWGNPISDYDPLRRLITAIAAIQDHPGFTLDINIPPVFTEDLSTTFSVAENTAPDTNIGAPFTATDADNDNDTLSYSLDRTDGASFHILDVSGSGQLQTSSPLDYETKTSYSVTITVSDGEGGTDTIDVTINITDVDGPIIHRTQQVQDAIVAAIDNVNSADAVTEAHLAGITRLDLSSAGITSLKAGDFSGLTALTRLDLQHNSISDISALKDLTALTHLNLSDDLEDDLGDNSISDVSALEGLTALEDLFLRGNPISDYGPLRRLITAIADIEDHPGLYLDINIPPEFTEGTSTTRSVVENAAPGTNIGAPVSATDVDSFYFSYSLGGIDAESFSINVGSGQLQTSAALDYETKASYSVTVSVSDDSDNSDSITVDIEVIDFDETSIIPVNQRTQQVQDAIVAAVPDVDNADAVTAAHLAGITQLSLSYTGITSLISSDFSGLISLTHLYLSNNSLSDISALTDLTTLTWLELDNNSISDISVLEGMTALEALYLRENPISDYEPLRRLKATIEDAGNSINIDIDITNNPPQFTDGDSTTRSVSENMAPNTNVGAAIAATDADNDSLTYSLSGTDADNTFSIDAYSGQLQTNAVLDFETKASYSVMVSVSDGNGGSDIITVDIEVIDVDETLITPVNQRTQQVQAAIVAAVFDVDNADDVTPAHLVLITELYLSEAGITALQSGDFSGLTALTHLEMDRNAISDISALAELTTLTWLVLDFNSIKDVSALEGLTALETLSLYGNPISDYEPLRRLKAAIEDAGNAIYIDIDLTNNPPQFTDGDSTTRSVSENMAPNTNVGAAIAATDADDDSLNYSLGGTDANSFSIDTYSGQLQTTAVLDFETKASYSVTVSVSDEDGGSDIITVDIEVIDVDETSIIPVNQRTQQVQDAIVGAVPGVDNADDVTPAHLALITELYLFSTGITSLQSGDFSGLTALTNLDLGDNSLSDISALADLTSLTHLYLSNNSLSDISALEELTTLTDINLSYNSLSDVSALEELTTLTWLDLSDNSISDVSALEELTALTDINLWGNPISDYGPLRRLQTAIEDAGNSVYIDIDMTNNPPVFTDGDSTTRSVAENTEAGQNIGTAVAATDADSDTLTYSLSGTDADAFDIVSTSGQLQTKDALDYETKSSYTVTLTVYDGNSGGDRITVTIDVTENVEDENVRAAPSVETSPIIPENTALLTNFPNPFNPETWIPYQLAEPAAVTLTIYDIRGVVVRELKLGHQPAGVYHSRSRAIYWDGSNAFGEKVATGVYFYTLKAGEFTATRKLLIRK